MRAFAIADTSKRKARPIGLLAWEPDADCEQGRFLLAVSSDCEEADVPLSLSFCLQRRGRIATPAESEEWVRSRIVPEDRHNIVQVLAAHGLTAYSEVDLLAACLGRASDDDFLAYEIDLPADLAESEAEAIAVEPERFAELADRVLASTKRTRIGSEVHYAFVGLGGDDATANPETCSEGAPSLVSNSGNAASSIGEQIRAARLEQGFTQRQLAARAGITQTVLSRVESGKGNPTLSLLEEIAAALGMRLDVLLVGK